MLLLVSIPSYGLFTPTMDLWAIAYLSAVVAFFSASQDIVLDAYRREILSDAELGLGTSVHVNAYRISGLVPGSLSLILADHLAWSSVFAITAMFMVPGLIMTLAVREPVITGGTPRTCAGRWLSRFTSSSSQDGSDVSGACLHFLYKLRDSMATAFATPFYLDMGFSMSESA
jgi:PAT family beta-lactamase induction signal transducer AmpG